MKTAAVVITYNPDMGIADRIKAIARECQPVFVIDNGSGAARLKALRKLKVKLIELGENTGIAHAQNVGLKLAFKEKADGVILFDHDSTPQKGFTAALWRCYENRWQKTGNPSIVGSRVFDINTEAFALHSVYRGIFFKRVPCPDKGILPDALMSIASGTLISRVIYEEIGSMREEFFIDYVDWEYCLHAQRNFGVKTVITGEAVLRHARGERRPKKFFGIIIHPPGYSVFRIRYLFHNRARVWREYFFNNRAFVAFEVLALIRDVLLLPFESGGWQKFSLAIYSWFRGLFGVHPKT